MRVRSCREENEDEEEEEGIIWCIRVYDVNLASALTVYLTTRVVTVGAMDTCQELKIQIILIKH